MSVFALPDCLNKESCHFDTFHIMWFSDYYWLTCFDRIQTVNTLSVHKHKKHIKCCPSEDLNETGGFTSPWSTLSVPICTFSQCALSDEVDVGVPSYSFQSIDLSASLTSCGFKYDRLESYEPSGHFQGKIPQTYLALLVTAAIPLKKGFLLRAVWKNTDPPLW